MRHIGYIAILVVLTSYGVFAADLNGYTAKAAEAKAADLNGYTAKYECRADGPQCDVDVVALTKQTCQQTVSPSTPWSNIDWSKDVICIEAGDHTAKGTLTIPSSANGTSSSYKVLRYTRASDSDDEPWNQSDANKAKLWRIEVMANYWLIHRLTLPKLGSESGERVRIDGGNDVIVNRILVEGSGFDQAIYYGMSVVNSSYVTLQNSVVRDFYGTPGREAIAVSLESGDNLRAVNNEIYDWSGHPMQIGDNGHPTIPGLVIENNDLYHSPVMHLPDGRSRGESPLSIKTRGTSSEPILIIHNRVWGARYTNTAYCCNGESGQAITQNGSDSYVLLQNNIIGESQSGLLGPGSNWSIIGNIFYNIKRFWDCGASFCNSHIIQMGAINSINNTELYLNTNISKGDYAWSFGGAASAMDMRCNVFLSTAGRQGGTPSPGTQVDYNAFYDASPFAFNSTNTNIDKGISTRVNGTSYSVDTIIRTGPSSNCTRPSDSACYLYKVTRAGTTASSTPAYCTTLGCNMSDGTVDLRAIRGPHTFYRKLRTSREPYTIPYARVYANALNSKEGATEAYGCPSDFADRPGIGINEAT